MCEIWEIEKFVGSGTEAPSFNGHKPGEIELELRCGDNRTVSWIKHIVPKLKPWRDAALRVVSKSEWQTMCKPKRMIRMSVIVPWQTTGSYFLDILRSNNPELRTSYWEIKHTQHWDKSTKFHLKVDETSVQLLQARNYRVHWLLDVIVFKIERGHKLPTSPKENIGSNKDGDEANPVTQEAGNGSHTVSSNDTSDSHRSCQIMFHRLFPRQEVEELVRQHELKPLLPVLGTVRLKYRRTRFLFRLCLLLWRKPYIWRSKFSFTENKFPNSSIWLSRK